MGAPAGRPGPGRAPARRVAGGGRRRPAQVAPLRWDSEWLHGPGRRPGCGVLPCRIFGPAGGGGRLHLRSRRPLLAPPRAAAGNRPRRPPGSGAALCRLSRCRKSQRDRQRPRRTIRIPAAGDRRPPGQDRARGVRLPGQGHLDHECGSAPGGRAGGRARDVRRLCRPADRSGREQRSDSGPEPGRWLERDRRLGNPQGGDIGVESAGFVPPGFAAGGWAYLADRGTPGNPHPGTDSVLRVSARDLRRAGVQEGDLLVASEGGGVTVAVRCKPACSVREVAVGPPAGHIEGHLLAVADHPGRATAAAAASSSAWSLPVLALVLLLTAAYYLVRLRRRRVSGAPGTAQPAARSAG